MYVDQVFAVNTAVNYLLLRTAAAVTGGRTGWRLWAGAAFGGVYAAVICLPGLERLGTLPGAALAYLGLCWICFGLRDRAWRSWLWFFGVCCAFAGLVLAVTALLGTAVLWRNGRVYYRVSGPLLMGLAGAVYLICRLCLDRFARHRGRELTQLRLTLAGRSLSCTALRDTGNTLSDPVTGEPVVVARWQTAARLLPELGLSRSQFADPTALALRLSLERPDLRVRLIPYRAVGTDGGLLLALRLDQILRDGKPTSLRLAAFSPTELSDGGSYEALVQG